MPPTLTDKIRRTLAQHVKRTGESYHAVARACRIQPASLYRFRDRTEGLGLSALDRLGAHIRFHA